MIAIAISLLYGLAAFVGLMTVLFAIMRGVEQARSIRREIAGMDAAYGRKVSPIARDRREEFPPLWPQPSSAA